MSTHIRIAKTITILTLVCDVILIIWSPLTGQKVRADSGPLLQPVTHLRFNFMEGFLEGTSGGTLGEAAYKNPPNPICSAPTSITSDINTDCEGTAPHNETTIAVNPTNPLNMIGSANDYQFRTSSGGTLNLTGFSRAHVTFDGGQTWTTYPIDYHGYAATGDPAVSFDSDGRAYLATMGFVWSQGIGCCTNPDILVATSADGGKTWSMPSRVVAGSGSSGSVGLFNDKEYITAWGNGNAIVTWTEFNDGIGGSYISSPIFASVTHNGGKTWSTPIEISGSAAFCIGAEGGNACNQSQLSIPVVAANGSILVAFLNYSNSPTGRDQYLVVKVDPNTGTRVAGPIKVADVFDGFTDYPLSYLAQRQTYQDSQFRTWAGGNIAADPTNAHHLAVIWSDMRNSMLPAPPDPYQAKTNSDIIASQSWDGGLTWSSPLALTVPGDQFMPWGAYDANGKLRIGFFDRSYDPSNHKYGYTLATEKRAGTLKFSFTQMTTTLSDPTRDALWFAPLSPNPAFPNPTWFLGDYSGIATTPNGVVGLWTDMRVNTCDSTRCAAGEDVLFAVGR